MISRFCPALLLVVVIAASFSESSAGTLEKYQLLPPGDSRSQTPAANDQQKFQQFEAEIRSLSKGDKVKLMQLLSQKQSDSQKSNSFQASDYYSQLISILARNL